jgi:tetratricopeptide (TPR) repeat protein
MMDAKRADPPSPRDEPDRESHVESLLVEGLDHYFHGRFEEAIHLWTRVLFVDRTHARARAYIDRARTALLERQRQGEAMLDETEALLDAGRTDLARQRLTAAAAAAGEDADVAAVRARLERLERIRRHAPSVPPPVSPGDDVPGWHWAGRIRGAVVALAGALVLAAFLILGVSSLGAGAPFSFLGADALTRVQPAPPPLAVPTASEVALIRARTLFERGRLAEALKALDRVSVDSRERARADQLRVEIQRLLLASVQDPIAGRRPADSNRR